MMNSQSFQDGACAHCGEPKNVDVFGVPFEKPYIGPWRNICRKCRTEAQKITWASLSSWESFLMVNLCYLDGYIDASPKCGIPIHPETKRILPGLKTLHEYGLLSTGSQPGSTPDGMKPLYSIGEGWFQDQQRPYYQFLIPTLHEEISIVKVKDLVDRLLAHADIVTTVWSDCDDYPVSTDGTVNEAREVAPISEEAAQDEVVQDEAAQDEVVQDEAAQDEVVQDEAAQDEVVQGEAAQDKALQDEAAKDKAAGELNKMYYFRSNAPPDGHWVTRSRDAPDSMMIRTAEWFEFTTSGPSTVDEIDEGTSTCGMGPDGKRFPGIVKLRPLAVQVGAREWTGDLDLLRLVEGVCQRVGLKKTFRKASTNYLGGTASLYGYVWNVEPREVAMGSITQSS
ncbi:hypothetical protein P171DRAFT_42843 [Karstenula rhodostoma CBS 690.94]|uniref:Uncharacterized protein n=1 Tax=Karstenula rhodostoma CBS 690.94 TaxID=1392251 RepID=A0A9P4PGI7_9PLEO|nr:hypothetical protein P171DRAFT_42843 [Karstenula rhodostoma CBS 690.94]